jgi:hypothetical protein
MDESCRRDVLISSTLFQAPFSPSRKGKIMRVLWKLLVPLTALAIGSALHPPMRATAQSRADLNRRLTDVESRVDRLIILLDGQALRWDELESMLAQTQRQLDQMESADAPWTQRLMAASAARQQLLDELELENQRLKSKVNSMKVQRHMSAVAPWGSHDPTKERDPTSSTASRPSRNPFYPRSPSGTVLQFRDGQAYRPGEESGGTSPRQPVLVSGK